MFPALPDSFYIIRATWPTISFCASSLTQLSHLQHSASFMSKNHEAKWGKREKQSYTLTPNIYSCLLLMSNKYHQSLWVIHWVKCTCLCRTCNAVCQSTTVRMNFCSADSETVRWNKIYIFYIYFKKSISYFFCFHCCVSATSSNRIPQVFLFIFLKKISDHLIPIVFSTRTQPIYQKYLFP